MKTNRIFFSKHGEGWFEYEVPSALKNSSAEVLGNWAYQLIRKYNFKGFLISENPMPFPIAR
ncbi:MAG: hypothetical protein JXJ22_00575 [Bacteroidales bacterium]|nr:hypothetical protein [Bacteroidales bacterium]